MIIWDKMGNCSSKKAIKESYKSKNLIHCHFFVSDEHIILLYYDWNTILTNQHLGRELSIL